MGSRELDSFSILHWFNDTDSHKCGYCKSADGSRSHGMWAESLTVEDYQDLIDRGWRRSGHYCYKPIMNNTCCPQYPIKCAALDINLSKSQKKVIKKLNRFLINGEMQKFEADKESEDGDGDVQFQEHFVSRKEPTLLLDHSKITESESEKEDENERTSEVLTDSSLDKNIVGTHSGVHGDNMEQMNVEQKTNKRLKKQKPDLKGGVGADPGKPKCKKAKLLRLERKQNKQGENQDSSKKSHNNMQKNVSKTIEQFVLDIPNEATLQYSLKLKLVRSGEPENEWKKYEEVEFQLYKKYQTIIHNDRDLSLEDFRRFLVSSPLIYQQFPENENSDTSVIGFGSFHQQYWLNDKLIAVGVIDILPKCISSVYLFYDPDYRNLTLGTYSSMREVHFTRFLNTLVPSIEYYYMGFYIHSCPKMRYKGRLSPSYLLCPETYVWIPIEHCIPKLEEVKYSRLSQSEDVDSNAGDLHEMGNVRVFVGHRLTFYKFIRKHKQFQVAMKNIGTLIGKPCASRMVFVLT